MRTDFGMYHSPFFNLLDLSLTPFPFLFPFPRNIRLKFSLIQLSRSYLLGPHRFTIVPIRSPGDDLLSVSFPFGFHIGSTEIPLCGISFYVSVWVLGLSASRGFSVVSLSFLLWIVSIWVRALFHGIHSTKVIQIRSWGCRGYGFRSFFSSRRILHVCNFFILYNLFSCLHSLHVLSLDNITITNLIITLISPRFKNFPTILMSLNLTDHIRLKSHWF